MKGTRLLSLVLILTSARNLVNTTNSQQDVYVNLPEFEKLGNFREKHSEFLGQLHTEYQAPNISIFREIFGRETDLEDESMYHSWETAWTSGKRRATIVKIRHNNKTTNKFSKLRDINFDESKNIKTTRRRSRRQIYGDDDRYYIPAKVFANKFPFASVVKVSTGCTGALVSQRHVITAAHCLHDQKDYVPGFRFLRVGLINADSTFEWVKVRSVRIPLGWKVGGEVAPHFDYALMRLEEKHERPFLPITISEDTVHGRGDRIHFTAFEDDKPWNTMWYRYCRVEYDSAHVLYHYCDAKPGSSGSGVYVWEYDRETRVWDRRLIGVFSGNRWLYFPEWYIPPQNFNAAIRITTLKYVQICKWMGHSGSKICNKNRFPPEPTPSTTISLASSTVASSITPTLSSFSTNLVSSTTETSSISRITSTQITVTKTTETVLGGASSIVHNEPVQNIVKPTPIYSGEVESLQSTKSNDDSVGRYKKRRGKRNPFKQLGDAT